MLIIWQRQTAASFRAARSNTQTNIALDEDWPYSRMPAQYPMARDTPPLFQGEDTGEGNRLMIQNTSPNRYR
jgi:hypothetical protein